MKKRLLSMCTALLMTCSIAINAGQFDLNASAAKYCDDWRYWSQVASDVWGVREYGCWIVAQAKLLYEANVDRSPGFNPDTYYNWEVANGYVANPSGGNYNQTNGGYAPVAYAKSVGKDLYYFGSDWDYDYDQLWYNINAGYYTILKVNGGGHYVYLANEISKAKGSLYIYDSFSTTYGGEYKSIARPVSDYTVCGSYVYKANNNNPIHIHNYTSTVTKQATCTEAGSRKYTCACGDTYTETIAKLGHDYKETVVAPTLTDDGYTLYQCSRCNDSYKTNIVPAPVLKDDGYYYCNAVPKEVTSDEYDIEYKNYFEKTQKDSPGTGWVKGAVIKNEWVNKGSAYTSESDLPTSDARVLVSSLYYHFCGPNAGNRSNYEQTGVYVHWDDIAANLVTAEYVGNDEGHPYYYLYKDGARLYCQSGVTCDGSYGTHGARNCTWYKQNTYQDREKIELYKWTKESDWTTTKESGATKVSIRFKAKHPAVAVEAKEATCTGDGNIAYWYCPDCDKYYADSACSEEITLESTVIKAAGHNYTVTATEPTCTEAGENIYTCENCGDTYTEEIPAKGHSYKVETVPPTRKEAGYDLHTCSECGKFYIDNLVPPLGDTPPTVSYEPGDKSVKLTWTEVPGAEKYAVCEYIDGKWQKLSEGTVTSYTLKNLSSGTDYKVAVIAKFDGSWSKDYSNAITVTPNKETTNKYPVVTSEVQGRQFRLKWTAVSGAEKYGIAVYQSNSWHVKVQVKSNTLSYTSPKMKTGTYKLVVCAKVNGEWDTGSIKSRAFTVTIA